MYEGCYPLFAMPQLLQIIYLVPHSYSRFFVAQFKYYGKKVLAVNQFQAICFLCKNVCID